MAKKIRFPLKMNGVDVRTIEELREHFDLESTLGYFANGKLVTWLRNRYYDNEADAIEALSADDSKLNQKMMSVLGVSIDTKMREIDVNAIQKHNEKLMLLSQLTDDKSILDNTERVAFTQDELMAILESGSEKVYLLQGRFEITLPRRRFTLVGIGNPTVVIIGVEDADDINTDVINIDSIISNIPSVSLWLSKKYINTGNFEKAIECISDGDSQQLYSLGRELQTGNGVPMNLEMAFKIYSIASEKGNPDAQYMLGWCYHTGSGVKCNMQAALDWYKIAAKNGSLDAKYKLQKLA